MSHTLPILMFHAIDDGPPPLCFPPALFRQAMARIVERGFRTVRLSEVAELIRARAELPERAVVLTFDDGDRSVYEDAWPILSKHKMTATVFALKPADDRTPRTFLGRPLLSRQQVQEMHRGGIDFGSHTLTHPDLTKLSTPQIEQELRQSKSHLEGIVGHPVSCFAYPFGRHDARCRRIARETFSCACGDALGLVRVGRSDVVAIERVESHYLRNPSLFDLIFSPRRLSWYLHVRNVPRRIRKALVAPPLAVPS
jgi:peptidoglycan/xylan/chitin deacetylase (PgdA/CDA1 family)